MTGARSGAQRGLATASEAKPPQRPRAYRAELMRLVFCAAAILIGCVVIVGWVLDLQQVKQVFPGFTTMKFNTALGLIAGGLGCLCIPARPTPGASRTLALACSAILVVVGIATLVEYTSGTLLGLDQVFVADPDTTSMPYPGRMSPATALAFIAAGISIMLLAFGKTQRVVQLAHVVAIVPAAISYLAMVGYAYNTESLYDFGPFMSVALHTAIGIALFTAGLLLTRLQDGWAPVAVNRPITASVLRRLLLLALILPFVTGQIIVIGVREHLYEPLFGPALFAMFAAATYVGLALHASYMVRTAEDELRRKTSALMESEAQFTTFAQAMPNHVWSASSDGLLDWFNHQTMRYIGLASEDMVGTGWAKAVHPDDTAGAIEAWQTALRRGSVYETEFRISAADQTYRWFLVRAEPIRGPSGDIVRWIGTNTDIDDQKRASARVADMNQSLERQVGERTGELSQALSALKFSTVRLRTAVETSFVFQGFLEPDGTVVDVNQVALDAIQSSLDDVKGRPFWETRWFSNTPGMPEMVREAVAKGGAGETTFASFSIDLPTGLRSFDFSLRPVKNEAADVVGLVPEAVETTERQAAEEKLRQAQKMEAVGQLTGGLAHDFNNLLTGITGSLELLHARLAQGRFGEAERYVNAAQGAARRAAALTHRLLAFSRRQTLDPRPTDTNRLVAGMQDLIQRTVGPEIAVETIAAGGLWNTLIDPGQLENALLNLCINARDAMPGGGRLTIETGNKWLDEHAAREREVAPGQYVALCVSDTGSGMSAAVVARAFDPFFTTKPIGRGTGLGLSMIYGFARQSGGQVRIYSETGQGTMVCLYLPRHHGDASEAEAPIEVAHVPQASQGETVLIIDDEPSIRMLITDVLESLGYTAIEAGDGASGLKVLQSDARIDLLVTDVGLPGGMNGRQVADAARILRPMLKVLFITGYAENAVLSHGHLDPGMHVLTKPFAMDVLARRVNELIAPAEA